jgi:LPXTG-motif cell wall-anchored protein
LVGSNTVYSEADINNTDQSVSFAKPIVLPNTGSRTGLIVNTLAVLLIGIGLYFIFRKRTVEQLGTHRFFGRKTGK